MNLRRPNKPSRALELVVSRQRLRATRILDLCDGAVRRRLLLSTAAILGTDWRIDNRNGREAVTQAWGTVFELVGFEAVIAPSSALPPGGTNVLIFPGNLLPRSQFPVDQEVRWV